jgi:hypothetical protein
VASPRTFAADPAPSATSQIGDHVTGHGGASTTVSDLIKNPDDSTAFVVTADGYAFLVKGVGESVYNKQTPPLRFIVLAGSTPGTVKLQADLPDGPTVDFATELPYAELQADLFQSDTPGDITPPIAIVGTDGIRQVPSIHNGSNGHDGALVVPPGSGGDGATGTPVTYSHPASIPVHATTQYGIEAGSVGGNGGSGGDSYLDVWGGADGGNGGAGGTVEVTNESGAQVQTVGDGLHGIFAYSRSGAAGHGGSGYAAPGGGTGGHSSNGGSVTVTNHGDVSTQGIAADGIYGLSVSNNGGGGGSQWGIVGSSGSGGFGGSGGPVSITNSSDGTIFTSGSLSHGILAQSVGGSGGSSGTSGNLLVSLNGSADNGGNGGSVSVTNDGTITTTGGLSRGIFAESVGGGGGTGGSNGGLISLGGSGSNGGSAGTVTVRNGSTGLITTLGTQSDGIFAQSVGGSGGSGSNANGLVAVGGGGSHAGNGGAVTVENYGTISTSGSGARGIVAQSVGGGGGDGGSSGGMVAVGGSGSGGGTSSTVTVTQGGVITTGGTNAAGIFAQSVGGGGGYGGSAGSISAFVGVAVGGSGGGGGAGGTVNLTLQGQDATTASLVKTTGDRSMGVFAQSVGGGGGAGGGAVQVTGGAFGAGSVAVGGSGGSGGQGGTVSLSKGTGQSIVQTSGADSTGVMLQSVGGGGGNGGYAVGVAASGGLVSGSVSVAVGGSGGTGGQGGTVSVGSFDGNGNLLSTGLNGSISTGGDRSSGLIAQSVGGGGGNGGLAVSVAGSGSLFGDVSTGIALGGGGASGGTGGSVSVGTQGDITTGGVQSTGLLVQSVGGGGGNGGGSVAATVSGSGGIGGGVSVGLGGTGGTGGDGGAVTAATRSGTITTTGAQSTGIVVQSVGGGGGNGGFSVAASLAGGGLGAFGVSVGLGGSGGNGGDAGTVKADLQSDVTTSGEDSGGILVQSVGGGGGNGGMTVDAAGAGAGVGTGAISVGLGGTGGDGGLGHAVNASSTGTITTTGRQSSGFIAQSVGGGGGNGGFDIAASGAGAGIGSGGISVGLGGSGGAGNDAGEVTALSTGDVSTMGDQSIGIMAQSVGGGGGNGGFNISASGSGAGIGSGAISVGLGGNGGAAGNGTTVNLTVTNDVHTAGVASTGIIAQSVGGGGGNGGFSVTANGSGAGIGSGAVGVGLGGNGASGGNGGAASATVTGDVGTLGAQAEGILVQSVGGGGGNGGFSVTAFGSGGGVGSGAIAVGIGGQGSTGGNASTATLTANGNVTTHGSESRGVVVQSIGGGGGNGGLTVDASGSGAGVGSGAISVGVGGSGGAGGASGEVTADVTGDITTDGLNADGFVAQSIGGGGGNGALNITGAGSGAGVGSGAVTAGVGGSGGEGGDGNTVDATYSGTLTTNGSFSTGFLAQAVGGGGGTGGGSISAAGSGAGVGSGSVSVGVGGGGGAAGDGADVTAVASGAIETFGQYSTAVIAQSVGGGGGNGGYSISANGSGAGVGSGAVGVGIGGSGAKGGDGKAVDATVSASVHTHASDSTGVLVQSVGGGGGNGGFSVTAAGSGAGTGSGGVTVGLGGSGDVGGRSGDVTASSTGTIRTDGDRSSGFVAQSLGGGGGNGGFNVDVGGSGAGTGSGAVAVGLGGSGAGGGEAGSVTASTSGEVVTLGDMSTGILAQSVGGGGGNGGFNVNVAGSGAGTGSGALGVGLGGSAGAGSSASTVDLTVANDVSTSGSNSTAVVAQSIGGGGGNGGFNVNVAGSGAGTGSGAVGVGLGGSGGGGGNAGRVTTTMTGDISTLGGASGGLLVQSVGGGGGNGGFDVTAVISGAGTGSGAASVGLGGSGGGGGTADAVTSTLTGNVVTRGGFATGVAAQSIGGGGGNGGFNVSGVVSVAKTGTGAASVGIGGSGGDGGAAGTVDNTVTGGVLTSGIGSGGVLAQSIGGGGGNGGFDVSGAITAAQTGSGAASVGLGGSGGQGGNSAGVTNRVTGDVFTIGANAFGVMAQSVGGGGGNGGMNVSGAISAAKTAAGAVAIGIGGAGGGGGDAATVDNTIVGHVQTIGGQSVGIMTQSLGGGGGNGGLNVSGTITAAKTGSGGLAFGLGGLGGDGGDAGNATSAVTGGVLTTGTFSSGIVTQSLGGGGGNGALNVSAAVNLSKENGGALGVGIGGFGGIGGNAGDVTSTVTTTALDPSIITTGDNSSAVMAQSIGGGGGNGGVNVTAAVSLSGKSGAAIGVGVGGFGGSAGNAGDVTLDTTGDVLTYGNDSNGLIAQSIGGGGGNGGTNVTGALAILKPAGSGSGTTVAASIGVGGFGGGGGQAGDVDVTFDGSIVAVPRTLVSAAVVDPVTGGVTAAPVFSTVKTAAGANGLVAESIGGGGGNGAVNVSGGVSYAAGEADGHALLVGVGGFGGVGGSAGNVDVQVTGTSITAYGDGRSSILASSIGGGGGNGGLNVSGGLVSDSPLIVGVGGMGGNAGTAGDVTVHATTDLVAGATALSLTNGAGLMAQSLGGGGGNGGLNVSGGISLSKESNVPSVTFGIGGFGGAGAVSGDVNATEQGTIRTDGGWTHGIFAQSIAGGGGNGALNVSGELNWADSKNSGGKKDLTILAGLGGHGGDGADAGDATVDSSGGTITTTGAYSRGIFAQSIGGGGGTGGMNVTGVFAKNSSPVSVGVGGFGGGGGHAGAVEVTRNGEGPAGRIGTDGEGAIGIEASSIGGGGGDAGMNFLVGISLAGSGSGSGGSGGSGGSTPRTHPKHTGVDDSVFTNYDAVLDELEGKAPTDSEDSSDANKESAFAAQVAIGGAGGAAGNGGEARVTNRSDIETEQDHSHGILAQSIGGGGGNATLNLGVVYEGKSDKNKGFNLAIGGAPGDAGDGAAVDVDHSGTIATHGENSYGVLAQSIGGGGGNAGLDLAYSKTDGGKLGITIGRVGGTGGSGGDVSLMSNGAISTEGSTSYGLLAQSVGNGGGNSSSTSIGGDVPAEGDTPQRAAAMSIGLEGGLGGYAGNVTLDAAGSVTTIGADSHAIFAQSVGGGGGNGGSATAPVVFASTAALAIGGAGGQGGTGGDVAVTSSASVRTHDDRSVGILAQSVGGGGGTGGMVKAGGLVSKGSSAVIGIGGSGGAGMSSGTVSVDNSGIIITDGEDSHGVLAQSIGGGGGDAGLVINSIANRDAAKATQIGVSVGGSGGDGATSGTVSVTNTGGIGTSKINSVGIFAQSIGGGGGNANTVVTGTVSTKGAGNKISVGIGGSGGTGGAAGDVSVSNAEAGQIITLNHYSPGILAMSVGGGGGTGSTTITSNRANGVTAETKSTSVAFSLGGAGGTGGTGGGVSVDNAGAITTYGYKSHGIVAQSIGGGGGNGGTSIAGDLSMGGTSTQSPDARTSTIAIGGFGGDGNRGGDVTVTNSGAVVVNGDNADGIYAQSVGGGGGDGGFAAALSRTAIANPKTDLARSLLNVGLGGNGGSGGRGGDVRVDHTGSIESHGDNAYGIFAQSVGGGGGSVGSSISSPIWSAADFGISALAGARDGASGEAGTVTVNTTGDITMYGDNSQAQFTQAVSGGGGDLDLFVDISRKAVGLGDGGIDLPTNDGILEKVAGLVEMGSERVTDAAGSAIDATHVGDLYTWGQQSVASLVQSVGGGGGNANATVVLDEGAHLDLELALGAKETNDSSGGDVTLHRVGDVQTVGEQSQGTSVQSIGGGGGRVVVDVGTIAAHGAGFAAGSSTATVGLGADPSFNNHGGQVDLALTGTTVTTGDYSPGLVVQSIGAGGGQAFLDGFTRATVNIGATDGSTGDGGGIDLANTGAVATAGTLSDGVVLQSIGGGGGYVLTGLEPDDVAVQPHRTNAGDGGRITFTQVGDIVVTGDRSRGVIAQSLGGGGGVVDDVFDGAAGGSGVGGAITLKFNDDVLAPGAGSTAILAESLGRAGGNITIALAPETLVLGGVGGTGVAIGGGAANSLVNESILTTMSGVDGLAITGTSGNDHVDNFATIIGSVDLGGGVNGLNNAAAAWFTPGATLNLGGGTFFNAGTFDPGGDTLQTVALNGRFEQGGRPTWFVDIADGSRSDGLVATGGADLGTSLTTVNLRAAGPLATSNQYTLIAASSGLEHAGFRFGTYVGEMPIGQTFSFAQSPTRLGLDLLPSTGTFYWDGAVSSYWSDPFIEGRSNWSRGAGESEIYGTPGAASDVIVPDGANTALGADFTIGSLTGTGAIYLDGHTLQTGANDASTRWDGTFSGEGHLVKVGTGIFTLSGVSLFDGSTTVAAGQLLVNGWLLGNAPVRVLDGGLLGGHGGVPSVTVERGGVLSPGASIGALTVTGSLTFDPGSIYRVETAPDGSSDLTWVNGALSGSDATIDVRPGDGRYHPITMFAIIGAHDAGPGVFSSAVSDVSYLDPSLQYESAGVFLTLRRNDVDFRSAGTRGNQTAVALSLNGLVRTATGGMADVINTVYDLSSDDAVHAMGSMTGVVHQQVAIASLADTQVFIDANMARLGQLQDTADERALGVPGVAAAGVPQGGWFSGVGGVTRLPAGDGDPAARMSTQGFAFGYDAALGPHLVLGASGGRTTPDLRLVGVSDESVSQGRHAALYAQYADGPSRLTFVGGVSRTKNTTSRPVTDGAGAWTAGARYDDRTEFARVQYGRTFALPGRLSVEPQAGLQYAELTVDGFTEQGADVLSLVAPERTVSSTRSFLGGRLVKTFGRSAARLEARAAWAHDFNTVESVSMRFLGDTADNAFGLASGVQLRNSAVVGGTVMGRVFRHLTLLGSVDGIAGGPVRLFTASVGLRADW